MHTDMRDVAGAARDLVLAVPIINAVVEENAAAMGVDVDTVIVRPELAVCESRASRFRRRQKRHRHRRCQNNRPKRIARHKPVSLH